LFQLPNTIRYSNITNIFFSKKDFSIETRCSPYLSILLPALLFAAASNQFSPAGSAACETVIITISHIGKGVLFQQ
jgi:hypothetical protein